MDFESDVIEQKILTKRKVNNDGSVSITVKPKKEKKKKVIIAKGKGEHTIGNVITSSLIPFRKSMVKLLKTKGIYANHISLKNTIPLFYNEFVSNKDNPENKLLPINSYEFRNSPLFKIKPSDNYNGEISGFHADHFMFVDNIVNNIIGYYSEAKAKKEAIIQQGIEPKEVLSNEELSIANTAQRVEKELENKSLDAKAFTEGKFKNILLITFGILLLYYLVK